MTNDLRNEIASCLHEFGKGCSETGSGNPANCRHCTQAAADAILAKLDPDALIVAALEAAADMLVKKLYKPIGSVSEADRHFDNNADVSEVNEAIRSLAADPEVRAAIKAKAGLT